MSFPRYPAYKDSGFEAVPKIPERWVPTRLRFLLRDGYDGIKIGPFGSQLTSDMLDDAGDYKVYGQEHVIANDFDRGSRYIDRAKFEELTAYEIKSGDLLVTMMGTSGRCDVVPSKIVPGVMDSHLLRIRVTPSVKPEFVRLLIDESAYVGTQIDLAGKGSIMHGLNSTIVKNLLLFVPPVDEQAQILTFLDHETAKIDALVAEQERLIELLKEKRQAVISHAVTKGLDPSVPMKDSGVEWLGEVPAHWEVRSISSVSTKITNGYVGPTRDILVDDGVRYLQSLHIKGNRIRFDQPYYVRQEWSLEHRKSILETGDVLIVQTGDIGQVAVVPPEFAGCNCHALIIVSPIRDVLSGEWLSGVLNSDYGLHSLLSIQTGALHPHLNCGNVKFLVVPVPPRHEQDAIQIYIAERLNEFDDLIHEAVAAINLLRERRTALISAAVTGQIDVRHLAVE